MATCPYSIFHQQGGGSKERGPEWHQQPTGFSAGNGSMMQVHHDYSFLSIIQHKPLCKGGLYIAQSVSLPCEPRMLNDILIVW